MGLSGSNARVYDGPHEGQPLAVAAFLASVLVAFVPVLVHRRSARVVSAVLLWVGCVVGMLSVGMFFVPPPS